MSRKAPSSPAGTTSSVRSRKSASSPSPQTSNASPSGEDSAMQTVGRVSEVLAGHTPTSPSPAGLVRPSRRTSRATSQRTGSALAGFSVSPTAYGSAGSYESSVATGTSDDDKTRRSCTRETSDDPDLDTPPWSLGNRCAHVHGAESLL